MYHPIWVLGLSLGAVLKLIRPLVPKDPYTTDSRALVRKSTLFFRNQCPQVESTKTLWGYCQNAAPLKTCPPKQGSFMPEDYNDYNTVVRLDSTGVLEKAQVFQGIRGMRTHCFSLNLDWSSSEPLGEIPCRRRWSRCFKPDWTDS